MNCASPFRHSVQMSSALRMATRFPPCVLQMASQLAARYTLLTSYPAWCRNSGYHKSGTPMGPADLIATSKRRSGMMNRFRHACGKGCRRGRRLEQLKASRLEVIGITQDQDDRCKNGHEDDQQYPQELGQALLAARHRPEQEYR